MKKRIESSLLHKHELHNILSLFRNNFIYQGASYSTLLFSEWPFYLFLFLWIDLSFEKKKKHWTLFGIQGLEGFWGDFSGLRWKRIFDV